MKIMRKILKSVHLHTVLVQAITTIFIDQMPTCLVKKKIHFMLASTFSSLPYNLRVLKNGKAIFKVAEENT
jgi:hypothetical protein